MNRAMHLAALCSLAMLFTHAIAGRTLQEAEDPAGDTADQKSIMEMVKDNADFSTLAAAIEAAGLAEALMSNLELTVFAPNNAAFDEVMNAAGIDAATLLQAPNLMTILQSHAISGKVMAADIGNFPPDGEVVTTMSGYPLTVKMDGDTIMVDDAKVIMPADLEAKNGVIHTVDKVLTPLDISPEMIAAMMPADTTATDEAPMDDMMADHIVPADTTESETPAAGDTGDMIAPADTPAVEAEG